MKKKIIISFIFLSSLFCFGQEIEYGFQAGLSFNLSNKVSRIGLRLSGFAYSRFIQINGSVNGYYNFQSLGVKQKTPELQLGLGAQFGFGKTDTLRNEYISLIDKNFTFKNSLGYTYLIYLDKQNTTQTGGILSANFHQFTLATENDLFGAGKGWRDRFRTGAFLVEYQYNQIKFGINSTLWTGDYTGCTKVKDSDYPSRFGYVKNDKAIYGSNSLGLLSLQVKYIIPNIPYQQIAQLNLGIDSEKIRNSIQNKFIHNTPFLPDSWVKYENYHIPMLQKNGEQFLYQPDQKIKPTSVYFNLGMNNSVFY